VVTIVGAGLLGTLAVFGAVAYRRRDDKQYLIVCGVGVIGFVIGALAWFGGRAKTVGPFDLVLAACLFVVVAEAVGLPAPLAKRLGVGFRSREWEYDRALARVIARIQELSRLPAQGGCPGPRSEPRTHDDQRRLIARLRALRAPDERWRQLTDAYADAYEAWFEIVEASAFDRLGDLEATIRALHAERERLRAEGRARAAAILAESRAARLFRRKP
jgi:hypothetical protein